MPSPFPIQYQPDGSLTVECYISTSKIVVNQDGSFDNYGVWLDINDNRFFKLAKGSFEETGVQFRREEVTNPFIEGSYTVNALRNNSETSLQVRVFGDTTMDVQNALTRLTNALNQVSFKLQVIIENVQYIYSCYASDYQVQTSQEMLHARQALVRVTLNHDPVVSVSEVI